MVNGNPGALSHYGDLAHYDVKNTSGDLEEEYGWFIDGVERYVSDHPEEFLAHFGIKGMKWGVRKDRPTSEPLRGLGPDKIVRKTASGETLTLTKNPPTFIHKGIAKLSKNYRDSYRDGAHLTISNGEGKKVGEANVWKKSDDELYLNWIGIDSGHRGKGYASAALKAAEEFGRSQGFKKMTLEVPTKSPDARHIYEKMGFKVTRDLGYDPLWGGLTEMEYRFDPVKHHLFDNDSLQHYGVKGMKWGVRKSEPTNSSYSKSQQYYDHNQFGKGGVRRINRRLNNGQSIKEARNNERKYRRRKRTAVRTTVIGGSLAARIISVYGPLAAQVISVKAETNRGRAAAAEAMGVPRKATKPNRKGVYNITTL